MGSLSVVLTGTGPPSLTFDDGLEAAPSITFENDRDTGMWRQGADNPAWSTGGSKRLEISNSRIRADIPIRAQDGSLAAPGFGFVFDADTGIARLFTDTQSLIVGGVEALRAGITFVRSALTHYLQDGSLAVPGLTFWLDGDTGLRRVGANNVGIVVGGADAIGVTTVGVDLIDTVAAAVQVNASVGGVDETGLRVRDQTAGTVKRVSRGAVDSGGLGFRVLRIPN